MDDQRVAYVMAEALACAIHGIDGVSAAAHLRRCADHDDDVLVTARRRCARFDLVDDQTAMRAVQLLQDAVEDVATAGGGATDEAV